MLGLGLGLDEVEGNIRTRGKTKLAVSLGTILKCIMITYINVTAQFFIQLLIILGELLKLLRA